MDHLNIHHGIGKTGIIPPTTMEDLIDNRLGLASTNLCMDKLLVFRLVAYSLAATSISSPESEFGS